MAYNPFDETDFRNLPYRETPAHRLGDEPAIPVNGVPEAPVADEPADFRAADAIYDNVLKGMNPIHLAILAAIVTNTSGPLLLAIAKAFLIIGQDLPFPLNLVVALKYNTLFSDPSFSTADMTDLFSEITQAWVNVNENEVTEELFTVLMLLQNG